MRLLTIKTPAGQGPSVIEAAFAEGINHVSLQQAELHKPDQTKAPYDIVEIETATPIASKLLKKLTNGPSYDPDTWILSVRHPRSLLTQEAPSKETIPVATPGLDIFEDLWEYSHITYSLVGRVFLAALLVSYGMIQGNLPLMIAGLLFLPYHHQILAISFGLFARKWRLAAQGTVSLAVCTILIVVGGACVAYFQQPPLKFHHFGTLQSGFFIALIIGVAAGLASADDAGRRELIGLAATAHITIVPAWFGISLMFGFPEKNIVDDRLTGFGLNIVTVTVSALLVYSLLRVHPPKIVPSSRIPNPH